MTKTSAHVARKLANMFKTLGYHVTNVSRDPLDPGCKGGMAKGSTTRASVEGCPSYFYVDNRTMTSSDKDFAMASVYVFPKTLDVRFEPWGQGAGASAKHKALARELEKLFLSL